MKRLLLILIIFLLPACGMFLDIGERAAELNESRRPAGVGFVTGGVHATSPNYTIDQRININATDGILRGPRYEARPGY